MSDRLPFINILQSVTVGPLQANIPIALDIKILPDANIPAEPFYGVWLLDISGSMAGERLDNAKESLIEQVKILPDGTIYNLVTFESDVEVLMENISIDSRSRQDIISQIKNITDRGTTALHSALKKGVEIIRGYKGNLQIKKIILVSDGDPTDLTVENGNQNDPNYQKYFLLAKEALEYKASIDTVGALGDHNVYLMYEIAKQSTGKYIFAENEQELKTKMIIATEQTLKIAYSQPRLTVKSILGGIQLSDAVQYKPTVIRMPFERINDKESKSFLRSFEAGDTYQILVKGAISVDPTQLQQDVPVKILDLDFDFGKPGLQITKSVNIKFTNSQAMFKLNQDINKRYANVFTQAEEIADCTIRGDAEATQRIQGDETKKISD